jgi:hypothetical protein
MVGLVPTIHGVIFSRIQLPAASTRHDKSPRIVLIVSGIMVPPWLRGPSGEPTRPRASRSFSRILPDNCPICW